MTTAPSAASQSAAAPRASHGLNLFLRIEQPQRMGELMMGIKAAQQQIDSALESLHYVHFARFVLVPEAQTMLVITEYDGDLKDYVMDFAAVLDREFTMILGYVKDAPPLPVGKHPEAFWRFVQKNDRYRDNPPYSAYPQVTVLDIVRRRRVLPRKPDPAPAVIDRADVQSNILEGFRAARARHLVLRVRQREGAQRFLRALLEGSEGVQISTAERWTGAKPTYQLNLGVTWAGLRALGVAESHLQRFPAAFREGPAHPRRAAAHGDVGEGAPEHWSIGGRPQDAESGEHLLLSLYADDDAEITRCSDALRALCAAGGLDELACRDAAALDANGLVHFGYRDGFSQPRVAEAGAPASTDGQAAVAAGDVLLGKGYVDHAGGNHLGDLPSALCDNASYAAWRVVRQDVEAFERLLQQVADDHGLARDLVAAKLMGRWPDGRPLAQEPPLPGDLNRFDYAPSEDQPDTFDDAEGRRCPVGAHIRRANPRSAFVVGKPYSRRVVRRGMPYGPVFDAAHPDDIERGLVGLFIGADLESQFEFLMRSWIQGDLAALGIRGTVDPIAGSPPEGGGRFVFHADEAGPPIEIRVPRLMVTTGSLYVLLPGLGGLRTLAGLSASGSPALATPRGFDPDAFNPFDPGFRADPYPTYARFRRFAPVAWVAAYRSYWVFSHELVRQVCAPEAQHVFLKPGKDRSDAAPPFDVTRHLPDGLFFMDPPEHTRIRPMMNSLFAQAMADAPADASAVADSLVQAIGAKGHFDLVAEFAALLPLRVFMKLMGVPPAHWDGVARWVTAALDGHDKSADLLKRLGGGTSSMALRAYFQALGLGCPAGAGKSDLMHGMQDRVRAGELGPEQAAQTAFNFALGGYLSTEFLITTGVQSLLAHRQHLARLRDEPALVPLAVREMLRHEAPFQLADRVVAADTELGGVKLYAGDRLSVVFGSANRDEAVFDRPDEFDITRRIAPGTSFGFGHGIHSCIGAPLVDIVAPTAIRALLAAFPVLRSGEPGPWRTDPYFRSLTRLLVLTA